MTGLVETVDIRPTSSMLSLYRSMNYKAWYAFGEFIDNSYQSFLSNQDALRALKPDLQLRIEIVLDASQNQIVIEDNAAGIPESEVHRAFTPGAPPLDKSGHHQFGIGMKAAAVWFADQFEVQTRAYGEDFTKIVAFDIPEIIQSNEEKLIVERQKKQQNDHGTRIVLSRVHYFPRTKTLTKIRSFLASMYREPLRRGEMQIVVQGEVLKYEPPALLHQPYWTRTGPTDGQAKLWRKYFSITLPPSGSLQGSGPVLGGWLGILETGSGSGAGLSLIWRNKVVKGAGGYGSADEGQFKPTEVYGDGTTTKIFQRLVGEIDVSELPVKAFHDDIVWTPEQQEVFERSINELLDEGEQSLRSMINNYSPSLLRTWARQEEERKKAAETIREALAIEHSAEPTPQQETGPVAREALVSVQGHLGSLGTSTYTCELVEASGTDFVEASRSEDHWTFRINTTHPFARAFASEPVETLTWRFGLVVAQTVAELHRTSQDSAAHFFHREFERKLLAQPELRLRLSGDA